MKLPQRVGKRRPAAALQIKADDLRPSLTLVLSRPQVLNELNDEAADSAEQERVDEAAFTHHESQDEPGDEKT